MIKKFFICALDTTSVNPLEVATNGAGIKTDTTINDILDLNNLYNLLKRDALLIATIVIVVLLASMYFIDKADMIAERKKDIEHKLGIALIIVFLLTILNVLYNFANGWFN